jgi:hypothetical protein
MLALPTLIHFGINGIMDRGVVEYRYGRTFIALQGDLLKEFDDSVAFDRRIRDMVSQCVCAKDRRDGTFFISYAFYCYRPLLSSPISHPPSQNDPREMTLTGG